MLADIGEAIPRGSRLLDLPPELREQIWHFAVTEWAPVPPAGDRVDDEDDVVRDTYTSLPRLLQKAPIRMDRFNRPSPPPITRVCRQTRQETLHLYYSENVFECWSVNGPVRTDDIESMLTLLL
ncbi:hypothetical protein BAUCODRAFT_34291 [Baudoinia panamericana UAMH 10762]|uniref:2EXR domain-containing protein n=1 Tax=Baudoinia panamericana (strain UAMH 10762) TaxID=717646 RepID=M2MVE9_BAUPA|nr:uncharacterized protein BAUCODRAFT_34291 [Baudoinia panamericana UAMH 10762]EMC95543.1 hypothetical protein BAUCODRAFT_34291 [Baudoinia panamericana UAMH 10762]